MKIESHTFLTTFLILNELTICIINYTLLHHKIQITEFRHFSYNIPSPNLKIQHHQEFTPTSFQYLMN